MGTALSEPEAEIGLEDDGFQIELGGYGELGFAFHDYGPDQTREGGALDDARLEFDTTRFVLAVEGEMPAGLEFEAEIELEHGGTGAAREIEYEEFGEFETEVEKGGEVILEELYLAKELGPLEIAAGRFYVAFGNLSYRYWPTDYLGAVRSEAETTIIPAQWDEMGVQLVAHLPRLRLTGQIVNGLDSTGFSSAAWVSPGHQAAFETVRASDLAAVGRIDVDLAPEPSSLVEVGASAYAGGTSRNRPKPDLTPTCSDPDRDDVAPCGYVWAPVLLLDLHAAWRWRGLRGQALAMWGHLWNADDISERNARLSNELGVARTPVADGAYGVALEAGYDLAPLLGLADVHAVEPFVRLDHYDTMAQVRETLFDNPRFERTAVGLGVDYTFHGAAVAKLEAGQRRFGSSALRTETTVRLTAGFVY